jgi:hypothetical protein
MEAIRSFFEPITKELPPGVRDFLDGGGWWLVLGILGLIVLLILWLLVRALGRALFGRRPEPKPEWDEALVIHLADLPAPTRPPGSRRLTVYHLPARLRLVVLAPAGKEHRIDPGAAGLLLEQAVPGLGAIVAGDRPVVRIWPPQLSHQGFSNTFHRCAITGQPEGQPSRWALLGGRMRAGKQPFLIGLALWADQANIIGRKILEPHDWLGVLRLEKQDA